MISITLFLPLILVAIWSSNSFSYALRHPRPLLSCLVLFMLDVDCVLKGHMTCYKLSNKPTCVGFRVRRICGYKFLELLRKGFWA